MKYEQEIYSKGLNLIEMCQRLEKIGAVKTMQMTYDSSSLTPGNRAYQIRGLTIKVDFSNHKIIASSNFEKDLDLILDIRPMMHGVIRLEKIA